MIDNIRGGDLSARHLLLALRAGEPYRIVRALALEGAYSATIRGRSRRRAGRLLQTADALASRLGHPHALGVVALGTGVAAFLEGSWRRAQEFCDQAEGTFRDHCTGVAWELNTARSISLWALFFMGEVLQLKRRIPALLREAHERGNLYAATNFATLAGHLLWLADDDPEGARRDLGEVMGRWSQQGFHIQHVTSLIAQTQIDLYRGDGLTARDRLTARWPALAGSLLLRILQIVRIIMFALRARSALALAATAADSGPLLRDAERDARVLERENVPWSAPLAQLLRAGIAARRGDSARAETLLTEAASGCDAVDMKLTAAAARRRLGELLGGEEGRKLTAAADSWMTGQAIQQPTRMAAMLAPGFPG